MLNDWDATMRLAKHYDALRRAFDSGEPHAKGDYLRLLVVLRPVIRG